MQHHQATVLTVVLIVISLIGVLSTYVGTSTASEVAASTPSGPVLWSCDFESGSMQSAGTGCFNVPNPSTQDVCPNSNNPGVVESSTVYSGNYAGYYASGGNANPNLPCRSYWNAEFGGGSPRFPAITTDDFYVDGWFYVPSATISGWVSFITLAWASSGQPDLTIDSIPTSPHGQSLYIHDVEWTTSGSTYYYQTNPITWPFDTWFNIGFAVHLVPAPGISTYQVYQNGVEIIDASLTIQSSYTRIPNLHHIHFGLYMGPFDGTQNAYWSVYNDDLVLEDLSGTGSGTGGSGTVTVTSTVTGTVTRTVTSLSTLRNTRTTTIVSISDSTRRTTTSRSISTTTRTVSRTTTQLTTSTVTTTSVSSSLGLATVLVLLLTMLTTWGIKGRMRREKHSFSSAPREAHLLL